MSILQYWMLRGRKSVIYSGIYFKLLIYEYMKGYKCPLHYIICSLTMAFFFSVLKWAIPENCNHQCMMSIEPHVIWKSIFSRFSAVFSTYYTFSLQYRDDLQMNSFKSWMATSCHCPCMLTAVSTWEYFEHPVFHEVTLSINSYNIYNCLDLQVTMCNSLCD